MIGRAQSVANVMQKGADHVLLVLAILMRQRCRLQAVGQTINRKPPAVALKKQKMFLDSPSYCAPELEKFSADDLPVFPRAIFHVMELSALWQSLVHGYLSLTEGLRIPIC